MKAIIGALLAASLLGNVGLLYCVVDQAVTITHSRDGAAHRAAQFESARKLALAGVRGKPAAVLIDIAHRDGLDVVLKGDDELNVGGLRFSVANGVITAVNID